MKRILVPVLELPDPPRRRFLQGLVAGGVLLGASPWLRPVFAHDSRDGGRSGLLPSRGITPSLEGRGRAASGTVAETAPTATGTALELRGTEFDLTIAQTPVNYTGRPRLATTVNGSIPGPTLRWRLGDTVTLRVTNRLAVDTSIHWHGILLPFQMDGVPGISFHGIAPGETFTYRFQVQQTGTYWYHSHSGMQEQTGLYGAIVIDPPGRNPIRADREYVVQLSDWTDEDPHRVLAKLKTQSDYYNFHQPTAKDFLRDARRAGVRNALENRQMWNQMRMSPADLADVSGYTYTYLTNGVTPAGNWTGLFRPGEKLRLRFINSGAMTFFDVRIPGLKMTVVQTDGQDVEPVTVDEIRIGVAETYDVIVQPKDEAYTIFAQSMDRTGYARGTLAVRAGLTAPVPEPDRREMLTMTDMMGAMDHSAHGDVQGRTSAAGGRMPGAAGMAMDHSAAHGNASAVGGRTPEAAKHVMPDGTVMGGPPPVRVRHAKTEYGPSTDMRVDTPRTNLDDPGIGLRNNGRRVLTYADLHTVGGLLDPRAPGREIELHLTGNMERFTWSFDGLEFGKSSPVHFRHGERLRVVLVNDTMMTHPMHMHGMWQELESPDGKFQVRKHTISVQPAQRVTFLVSADDLARGRWAWHCHLLLHMDAGMFREVVVA